MPDVEALRKLRDAGVPALLYGPPGTGKTSLIEAAFGDDLITVAGDGDTTAADLVGEYTQKPDGTFEFRYVAEHDSSNVDAARELRLHEMRKGQSKQAAADPGLIGKLFKR